MKEILDKFYAVLTAMKETEVLIGAILFVITLSLFYFFMFKFLKDNGAKMAITIFVSAFFLLAILFILLESLFDTTLFILIPITLFVFVAVVFSTELKRTIWEKSSKKFLENKHGAKSYNEEEVEACITEIIKAVQNLSKNDMGAIIVLSNGNVPERILQSGTMLNSDITSQLVESIFYPKTPLHDGAMIISGTKIIAAGCFLPLSQKENLPKELGTRHRAGIGITETIDVTSIIVSEETGIISTVKAGNISRYADTDALKKFLRKFYWQEFDGRR